jgi:hypothetical protein
VFLQCLLLAGEDGPAKCCCRFERDCQRIDRGAARGRPGNHHCCRTGSKRSSFLA